MTEMDPLHDRSTKKWLPKLAARERQKMSCSTCAVIRLG